MSKLLLSISVFVAVLVAATASTSDLDFKWAEFKVIQVIRCHKPCFWLFCFEQSRFAKAYKTPTKESARRQIWEANYNLIQKHNQEASAGLHLYTLEENRFTDLVQANFSSLKRPHNHWIDRLEPHTSAFDVRCSSGIGLFERNEADERAGTGRIGSKADT